MVIHSSSPILVSKTRTGKNKYWRGHISKEGSRWFTQTSYWQRNLDGTDSLVQYSEPYEVLPKNVGRANATTAEEQAVLELERMVTKQKDKGYTEEGEKSTILPLPMLAQKFVERGDKLKGRIFVQAKLDGCLYGNSILETSTGKMTIKEIVENKIQIDVLSYNEITKKSEFKPIINWFKNGIANYTEWMDIVPETGKHIKCTKNHKFFTDCGWIEAENLNPKKHKILIDNLSDYQISLIIGTLLGDSHIAVERRKEQGSYRLCYSHVNDEYYNFKTSVLGLTGNQFQRITGYGSTATQFVGTSLLSSNFPIKEFYDMKSGTNFGKRKLISYKTLSKYLRDESISLWIADDGSISYNNGNKNTPILQISTHNFSKEQQEVFVEYFRKKWQCTPSILKTKLKGGDRWFLQFNTKDTLYLLNRLREKHIKGAEYKFYFPTEGYISPATSGLHFEKFHVRHAKNMNPAMKYDIEVQDNHNYIANGMVVHNCRMLYDGEVGWSRGGKYIIPEVIAHLQFDTGGVILDGELMLPGNKLLQESMTAIKKYRPGLSDTLEYYVYDIVDENKTFAERYEILRKTIKRAPANVILHQTHEIDDLSEVYTYHNKWTIDGFEGTMIRDDSEGYDIGHRSNQLQKLKDFQDGEWPILDVIEGDGRFKGLAIFVCRAASGKEFNCTPEGSTEIRQQYFKDRVKHIGKYLSIRYQTLSKDAVPIFPIGVGVRDRNDF